MSRNIDEVISNMVFVCENEELITRLKYIAESASYKPPEQMIEMWIMLSNSISSAFGDKLPDKDTWQYKVAKELNPDIDKFY
jgi:hypothetical protein